MVDEKNSLLHALAPSWRVPLSPGWEWRRCKDNFKFCGFLVIIFNIREESSKANWQQSIIYIDLEYWKAEMEANRDWLLEQNR